MAIVTRYFSTTAAGAGDGTTWADRAALLSSGAFSSIIYDFDFTADSMLALVGPGTYTVTTTLHVAFFTLAAPSSANPLIFHGCDSSGAPLAPPNPAWTAAEPAWDASSLPVLATTTNIAATTTPFLMLRLLRFTASGRNGPVTGSSNWDSDWCVFEQSTSDTSAIGIGANSGGTVANSVAKMTGTAYAAGLQFSDNQSVLNCRIEGNPLASSGTRYGVASASVTGRRELIRSCIFGHAGAGFAVTSTSTQHNSIVANCVLANNGGDGWLGNSTASQTNVQTLRRNMITSNGGYGIKCESSYLLAMYNRLRDNTSGNFNGFGNRSTDWDNIVATGTDADEYVDAANGDYRIKYGSSLWGLDYGVSDERLPGPAELAEYLWETYPNRTLT